MQKISTNAIGVSSLIATVIYLFFNVEIETATIDMVIAGIVALIGIITTVRNQIERPTIKNFFMRK